MKKLILNIFLLSLFSAGYGQTTAELINFRPHKLAIDSIAEALADIAADNPQLRSSYAIIKSAEYQWKASKYALLSLFTVQGNLNEFTIKAGSGSTVVDGRAIVYPRYNFGVRIPIGELFSAPRLTKASYYKYESEIENARALKLNIRKKVIAAYQDYALTQKLIVLQQEVLQDQLTVLTKAEEQFKNGELSVQGYTFATRSYNSDEVRLVTLNRDLKIHQAEIEELIGMPLEDAFEHLRALREGQGVK